MKDIILEKRDLRKNVFFLDFKCTSCWCDIVKDRIPVILHYYVEKNGTKSYEILCEDCKELLIKNGNRVLITQ